MEESAARRVPGSKYFLPVLRVPGTDLGLGLQSFASLRPSV
jgi:hypothetical protein